MSKHRPSKNQPKKVNQKSELYVKKTQFRSGPLPSPEELQRFNAILPGLADRIVTMAEKEQETAHKINLLSAKSANQMILAGWFCSLLCLIGFMALAYFAIQARMAWVAFATVSSISIAGVFVYKGIKKYL